MDTSDKTPPYVRTTLSFVGIFTLITALYLLQGIIVPLVYATILAIVLSPIVNLLVRKKMKRILAITLTVSVAILVTLTVITLLLSQLSMFTESLPKLLAKFDILLQQVEGWLTGKFNIRVFNVHSWMNETSASVMAGSRSMVGQTLVSIGSVLVVLILIPVYVFMILLYQPILIEFIHKLFSTNKRIAVNAVLSSTKKIIQSYLVGLSVEALIVAVLNVTCLLILGIDYAIFLGAIGAVLNVIPYIGGAIAIILPMLIAFATKTPTHALLVLGSYLFIQFVDNHFIIPKVVASKVKINALVSIIVVLAGGALWGLPGMFLSIPMTAILKVIFDHVEGMKPWGFLLGNIEPTTASKFHFIKQKTRPTPIMRIHTTK
jgi:predicted PurR-regulated permease PerM